MVLKYNLAVDSRSFIISLPFTREMLTLCNKLAELAAMTLVNNICHIPLKYYSESHCPSLTLKIFAKDVDDNRQDKIWVRYTNGTY